MSDHVEKRGFYPQWRDALETIRTDYIAEPEKFYPDTDLSVMIGETLETKGYAFAFLALKDELFRHGIVLIRDRERTGYKIATDQEKLRNEADRLFRRARNAIIREMSTLYLVDPEQLDSDDKNLLAKKRSRCGLRMLAVTPRIARQMLKHVKVNQQTPRTWLTQIDTREYNDEG